MNECMLTKATKVHVYVQCFSLFSKPEMLLKLTPRVNTVIIEVSSVKVLLHQTVEVALTSVAQCSCAGSII